MKSTIIAFALFSVTFGAPVRRQTGNLQTFTGALGGIAATPVQNSGNSDRPFQVKGDTFVNIGAALQRSCDQQFNACANAANGGDETLSTTQCSAQKGMASARGLRRLTDVLQISVMPPVRPVQHRKVVLLKQVLRVMPTTVLMQMALETTLVLETILVLETMQALEMPLHALDQTVLNDDTIRHRRRISSIPSHTHRDGLTSLPCTIWSDLMTLKRFFKHAFVSNKLLSNSPSPLLSRKNFRALKISAEELKNGSKTSA